MFKKFLLTLLLVLPAGVAMADDFPYFAFQTSDGETSTLNVTGLKITFSDGNIVATNADGASFTASIESLAAAKLRASMLLLNQPLPRATSTMSRAFV